MTTTHPGLNVGAQPLDQRSEVRLNRDESDFGRFTRPRNVGATVPASGSSTVGMPWLQPAADAELLPGVGRSQFGELVRGRVADRRMTGEP